MKLIAVLLLDPRSGIREGKSSGSGIRDKHAGSATLVLTAVLVTCSGSFRFWRAHSEEKVEIWPRIDFLLSASTGAVPISLMMGRQLLCAKYVPSHDDIFRAGNELPIVTYAVCIDESTSPADVCIYLYGEAYPNHSIAGFVSSNADFTFHPFFYLDLGRQSLIHIFKLYEMKWIHPSKC